MAECSSRSYSAWYCILLVFLVDSQHYSPMKRHGRFQLYSSLQKEQPPTPNLKAIPVFRHLIDMYIHVSMAIRQERPSPAKAKQKPRIPPPTSSSPPPNPSRRNVESGQVRSDQVRSGQLPKPDKRGEMGKLAVRSSQSEPTPTYHSRASIETTCIPAIVRLRGQATYLQAFSLSDQWHQQL
jgi:hypothetical protein